LVKQLLGPTAIAVSAWCAATALAAPPTPYASASPAQTPPAKLPDLPPAAPKTLPPPAPPNAPPAAETPGPLSADEAIFYALTHNPEIAALRQQHGIAAAGIIIARQYPFNPIWEGAVFGANGPDGAATNKVPITDRVSLELEVRGQPRIRREAAAATLSRTDWEIANQEVALAVRTLRAFDGVVYRFRKRRLIEDTIRLNQRTLDEVEKLLSSGLAAQRGITISDAIVLRTEIRNLAAQVSPAQTSLVTAWHELYRALGVTAGSFDLRGGMEQPPPLENDAEAQLQTALERRPDLRGHQVAVREAEARVRLEVANRFGNPSVGPVVEYNESRVTFIGAQLTLPLPVLNAHRGDIAQREAERARALLELRQNEVVVRQDVRAALARLEQARRWVSTYQRDVVPDLERALKQMQNLYEAHQGGADVLRVLDVQRKLLQARDIELDAVFELRQALADLALAVGDPLLAVPACASPK
jgi:outer membrane protein TolC